ncbi:MAG: FkbM family methyltransferase [Rhodospirillaceae bacterium]|nr:FkbM family methyltransferase [Rhodospirillaceae bacterium]
MAGLAHFGKRLKYGALRHLPGERGYRYGRKYSRVVAPSEFQKAIARCEGLTNIDLGANIGFYTRILAAGAKRVVAFEPDPWANAELRSNLADLENVTIENAAAGTSGGTILLYRHTQFAEMPALYSESSSVVADKDNVCLEEAVEVAQIDFVAYLDNLQDSVGILKIDIEGAEVELLEALFGRPDLLRRIEYIFVETHEAKIPGHKSRVRSLHEAARVMRHPRINMGWH